MGIWEAAALVGAVYLAGIKTGIMLGTLGRFVLKKLRPG